VRVREVKGQTELYLAMTGFSLRFEYTFYTTSKKTVQELSCITLLYSSLANIGLAPA